MSLNGKGQGSVDSVPAGTKLRPRSGQKMNEIFTNSDQRDSVYRQKIDNRSLATHDIIGAQSRRYQGVPISAGGPAGVRSGSPGSKN